MKIMARVRNKPKIYSKLSRLYICKRRKKKLNKDAAMTERKCIL